jgi:FKBP-type peptidyl-prolyl cis-trans isomerase 2
MKKFFSVLLIGLTLGAVLLAAGCSKGTSTATQSTKPLTTGLTATTTSGAVHTTPQSGDTVKVDYTLKLADGTVFDTSVGKTPFQFTLGQNQVIPGFENAVIGMKVGDSKTVKILAADAYGPRNESLVQVVPKTKLPAGSDPKVGMQLQGSNPDGSSTVFTIIKVDDTTVTLDGNSALAGKDLTFDIKLLDITAK